jgi:hypothetical protein
VRVRLGVLSGGLSGEEGSWVELFCVERGESVMLSRGSIMDWRPAYTDGWWDHACAVTSSHGLDGSTPGAVVHYPGGIFLHSCSTLTMVL